VVTQTFIEYNASNVGAKADVVKTGQECWPYHVQKKKVSMFGSNIEYCYDGLES